MAGGKGSSGGAGKETGVSTTYSVQVNNQMTGLSPQGPSCTSVGRNDFGSRGIKTERLVTGHCPLRSCSTICGRWSHSSFVLWAAGKGLDPFLLFVSRQLGPTQGLPLPPNFGRWPWAAVSAIGPQLFMTTYAALTSP